MIRVAFLLSLFIPWYAFAQDYRQNTVLEIYMFDESNFLRIHQDFYQKVFNSLRPELNYRRIVIDSRKGRSQKNIREDLIRSLENALSPQERLSFLILNTHGDTLGDTFKRTLLQHIGQIDEKGVNQGFKEIFNPLKNKANSNMRVILNSCSVFCGSKEMASERGKHFLNFFGASNGAIYGSSTIESPGLFALKDYDSFKYHTYDMTRHLAIFGLLATTFLALDFSWETIEYIIRSNPENLEAILKNIFSFESISSSFKATIFYSSLTSITLSLAFVKKRLSYINSLPEMKGYFISLNQGTIGSVEEVVKIKELPSIIKTGVTAKSLCRTVFM